MQKRLLNQELFLPCGAILKNRIAKAAMSENMGTADHKANSKFEFLYDKWSYSGAGLLITGNVMINKNALGEPANVAFVKGRDYGDLERWAKVGTQNNTHLWIQLNHPGKQSPKFLSKLPVAPSAIALGPPLDKMFNTPRALNELEIEEIIGDFAYAAKVSKEAGFTGVQIHGAHGYLVSQFLSPLHNQRSDKWGGTLQNRMRFVLAIYDGIRLAVGKNFSVSIKLNSADFQKGGFTKDESMEVVQALSDKGMDLIEISGGTYEAPAMTGAKKTVSTAAREAYFLEYCEEVRKFSTAPIMLTGGFRTSEGMDAALESGACDVIGLARSMALDPHFPNKLLAGGMKESAVKPLSTGSKILDRLLPLEITWYTHQLHRMGRGLGPKPDLNVLFSALHSLCTLGLQGLKKVRSK